MENGPRDEVVEEKCVPLATTRSLHWGDAHPESRWRGSSDYQGRDTRERELDWPSVHLRGSRRLGRALPLLRFEVVGRNGGSDTMLLTLDQRN